MIFGKDRPREALSRSSTLQSPTSYRRLVAVGAEGNVQSVGRLDSAGDRHVRSQIGDEREPLTVVHFTSLTVVAQPGGVECVHSCGVNGWLPVFWRASDRCLRLAEVCFVTSVNCSFRLRNVARSVFGFLPSGPGR